MEEIFEVGVRLVGLLQPETNFMRGRTQAFVKVSGVIVSFRALELLNREALRRVP